MSGQFLIILIAAMVAAVALFRLYAVLGRRTGQERPPTDRFNPPREAAVPDNVVPLPDRSARAETLDKPGDPVSRGLLDIQLADRKFEQGHFLDGAKAAYEMVVTAFAKGDRPALKSLLSTEVFSAFDGVLREREKQKHHVQFTFVGFSAVKLEEAALKGRMAEITVSFAANFISATLDAAGAVVDGDPKAVRAVADAWTFSRDVRASDPNWTIIATHGDEVT